MRPVPLPALLLALLLGFFPGAPAVQAEATACAVRLTQASLQRVAKTGAMPAPIAALPQPATAWGPLLAAGEAQVPRRGAAPGPQHPFAAWHVLRFADAAALRAAVALLALHPDVLEVEPVGTLELCAAPRSHSLGGAEIPWNVERIGAPAALAAVTPDTALVVAVIDTGADLTHPGLVTRLWRNDDPPGNGSSADDANDQNGDGFVEAWEECDDDDNGYVDDEYGFDFTDAPGQGGVGDALERDPDPTDEDGHGTHVAGIIAADAGLRGVAPFVRLMVLRAAYGRVFGSGVLETDDAAAAIVYAVDNGARVLNLSWGAREESSLIRAAIDYAVERGIVVVAAAGNGGAEGPHFPSGDPRVIGVAASDRAGHRAGFSNFGAAAGVEVAAPGEESAAPGPGIRSLLPPQLDFDGVRDGFGERRGTSMAAAHVSGGLALLLSRSERPDARRVRALLASAARRADAGDWSPTHGHGEIDLLAAVRSDDDLVVSVHGPAQPYWRGRLTLLGTVLSGDLPRHSLWARHLGTGQTVTLAADVPGQIVADTLLDAAFLQPQGAWEYVLQVTSADGRRRERHGGFQVDLSPPVLDTLLVHSAWRDGEPRWLVTLRSDEPVRTWVREVGAGAPLLAAAGYATQVQLEGAPHFAAGAAEWSIELENAAGLVQALRVPSPPVLAPWPETTVIEWLDRVRRFSPSATWGNTAVGAVVWGRGDSQAGGETMQAYGVIGSVLELFYDTGRDGFPVGFSDVNGDGSADLLFRGLPAEGLGAAWLVTRPGGIFPDSVAASFLDLRGLGLFQLDEDPPFEAVLARNDRLFLYDDLASGEPRQIQALENPTRTGFNVWGADALAGDLDADGRIELVCGDAEGNVAVFERAPGGFFQLEQHLDLGGTYAYDLTPLPEGGFLAGHQKTADVAGDGFGATVHAFTTVAAPGARTYSFLGTENVLRYASTLARSPATGEAWLALVEGDDLHLARGIREPRQLVARTNAAMGQAPVLADLDADGQLEVVLRTPDGTELYRLLEDARGPRGLRGESLGSTTLRLEWIPAATGVSSVRRWGVVLGTTSGNTWIDSTLTPFASNSYWIEAVLGDSSLGRSNRIFAHAQPLPRWLAVAPLGEAGLRLRCSNPVHPASLAPGAFTVSTAAGTVRVLEAALAEGGRAVDLFLERPIPCGPYSVQADSLRDDQWGLLGGAAAAIDATWECAAATFNVLGATLAAGGIEVEWSRAPDAAASSASSYELTWNGTDVPIAAVQSPSPARTLLVVDPASFVGRGIPYLLRVVGNVLAGDDGAPLEEPATIYRIYVQGQGASHVFPVPNPARGTEVTFAEAADDTRVRIFNLEGVLVRELRGALGGGLRWNLQSTDGRPVSSGVYLYVATDSRGHSRGRLAIIR